MVNYIIDTSTLLEGICGNPQGLISFIKLSEKVKHGKAKWYSTSLLFFELNNAIRYKFDQLTCKYLFEHFYKLGIKTIYPTKNELILARELAFETNTSCYDASFHILAFTRDMIFLTMDKNYYKKAKSRGHISVFTQTKF